MNENEKSSITEVVQLRFMKLEPQAIKSCPNTAILIRIGFTNASTMTHCDGARQRKFLFIIQQTDQQSPPLSEGEQYTFTKTLDQIGEYNLVCINYPKMKCTIEIIDQVQEKEPETPFEEIIKTFSPPLCDLTEVKEEKEDQAKQHVEESSENICEESNLAQYQRILSDQNMQYDYMPNKYLKYFKEQFKLWRDFFETPQSEHKPEKSSENKREAVSNGGSLSLSQRQSQKDQSVISHLHSQQQISDVNEEQLNKTKIMKKTNSEYCLNVDREIQKTKISSTKNRKIHTNASSPYQRTEQSQADTFVDWAIDWAQSTKKTQINIKSLNDRHLVRQWLTYMQNKFKISQFMYG